MKASKLMKGIQDPLATDLILYNALNEIDCLEILINDLQKQVDYYEGLFQKLKDIARCDCFRYGPFINIGNIYKTDSGELFTELMDLLQLEEPENKEEEDKNNDTV